MLLVSATGWRAAATPENYFLFFISFLLRKKKVIYFMNKNPTSDRRDDHFLWISDSNTVDETCLSVSLRMKSSPRQTCYLLQTAIMSSALSRGNWTCERRAARRHAPSGPLQGKKHNYLRGDCSACFLISGWFQGKIIWLVGIFVWAAASGGRGM